MCIRDSTTKGDSITFSTPTIEGTILRRNKVDAQGKHPWKAEGGASVALNSAALRPAARLASTKGAGSRHSSCNSSSLPRAVS